MKIIFQRIITDFIERDLKSIFSREKYRIPTESKKIVSLVGVRRSGKTYILFDTINRLRERIDRENVIYINFEDDRLFPLELSGLDDLLEGYYEMYPSRRDEKVYLFLDEVQVVENWEKYVRRIYDSLNVQLFITGSSSKLLSTEIATSLRGRTITYEVFPFSFKEFLAYKQIPVNLHSSKSLSHIRNQLQIYLTDGGFPETIGEENEIKRKILSDYLELIVYKDIVERYAISNHSFLKHLTKYCFTNIATLISMTKLYNDFKSQGFKISKDTVFNYFAYLEDAYALFLTPIYRNSVREEQRNPKKVYAVDAGFKKLYDYAISQDMSKLYENSVFLALRRKTKEIYYFKERQEVDFYAKIEGRPLLINVSVEIGDAQTKEREIGGLLEAMAYFKMDESYLITQDKKGEEVIEGKRIMILPLYEWLLKIEEIDDLV